VCRFEKNRAAAQETISNKKPRNCAVLGKRADTRGGLSKGLGAFRIGRPLVKDNRRAEKAFRRLQIYLQPAGRRLGMVLRRRRNLLGMAVGRTEQQRQKQDPRNQAFDRMFDDEGWNTHGAISLRCQNNSAKTTQPENLTPTARLCVRSNSR